MIEYLNHCYTTEFRLFIGLVETIVPVRWYFTPENAPLLPFETCFGSNVYAKDGEEFAPGPGEVDRKRVWNDGRNIGYQAKCILGDEEWFKTGFLPFSVLLPPTPAMQPCCRGKPCGNCISGSPETWYFECEGILGDARVLNGRWALPFNVDCVWGINVEPVTWTLVYLFTEWLLTGKLGLMIIVEYTYPISRLYLCDGPNTFALTQGQGSGAPETITVYRSPLA